MDQKALKVLFSTYWSSAGWKPEKDRITTPADYLYARSAGVMFDPIRLSHEEIVRHAMDVRASIHAEAVADAFLASLSTRRLELRSALGSYAVLRHFPAHHHETRRKKCQVCGEYHSPDEDEDLNILNFERYKWGGVRHSGPFYAAFDLEQFSKMARPRSGPEDLAIFREILASVEAVPSKTTAPKLEKYLPSSLKSNKNERDVLISILGFCGILRTPGHPSYTHEFVPSHKRLLPAHHFVDMPYPSCWWKGSDGMDRDALRSFFPSIAF